MLWPVRLVPRQLRSTQVSSGTVNDNVSSGEVGVLATLPTAQTGPHGVPALASAAAAAAAAPDTAGGFRYVKELRRLTYRRSGLRARSRR